MIPEIVRDFDEKAAARILGIAPKTLSRWRKAGKVGHYRTPTGRVRYSADDLLAVRREGRAVALSSNVRECPQLGERVIVTDDDQAATVAA